MDYTAHLASCFGQCGPSRSLDYESFLSSSPPTLLLLENELHFCNDPSEGNFEQGAVAVSYPPVPNRLDLAILSDGKLFGISGITGQY